MDTGVSRARFERNFVNSGAKNASEVFDLAHENVLRQNLSTSRALNIEMAFDERIDKYEELFGKRLPNPMTTFIPEAHPTGEFVFQGTPLVDVQREWFEQQIDAGRIKLPENQRGTLITKEEMEAQIPVTARETDRETQEAFENTSFFGKVSGFAGELTGFMNDPVILATFLLGWPSIAERTTLQAMARVGLTESLIAGGSEAVIQPIVQEFRKELGFEDAGFKAGLRNIVFATGAGGIFGAGLAGLSKGGQKVLERLRVINGGDSRALAKELLDQINPTEEEIALARQLNKDADLTEDNPLWKPEEEPPLADIDKPKEGITEADVPDPGEVPGDPELQRAADAEHDARTEAADEAVVDAGTPDIPDDPAFPPSGEKIARGAELTYERVAPDGLTIDAEKFQFKSQTDAEGVSKRLTGVDEWDQVKSGAIVVFEDAQGKKFVADGHQRVALAQRILQSNPDADIRLMAIVRKEADGFTAEDVMVEAAMKNIAETDVVTPQLAKDAARVLRVRPQDAEALFRSLPRSSTMVRTVEGLIGISDRSFRHVINEKVSATHAAMVGRLVRGKQLQDAVMDLLVREQVMRKTDVEAEAIIRQAREAGVKTEKQETLFGTEEFQTSLFAERAKILSKTLTRLKKEKTIFQNLVRNRGKIEGEGNTLKTDVNQQIADSNAVAVDLLMRLANRTGALSNALTEAARLAGETKQFGPAVDQFVESVREAIGRGDFEGVPVSGARRSPETPSQNRQDAQQRAARGDAEGVADFDEAGPGGKGVETQSRLFDEEVEARLADEALVDKKVPVDEIDSAGEARQTSMTFRQIADDIKDDDRFLDGLAGCMRGPQ